MHHQRSLRILFCRFLSASNDLVTDDLLPGFRFLLSLCIVHTVSSTLLSVAMHHIIFNAVLPSDTLHSPSASMVSGSSPMHRFSKAPMIRLQNKLTSICPISHCGSEGQKFVNEEPFARSLPSSHSRILLKLVFLL
ncbi:hypothetical protein DL93DRAFT_2077584 [Clavulina sp. PMI_390]|nr:hypothetical protein DL93DRAFT_2077584 [Clavulina sp. PMI_390]